MACNLRTGSDLLNRRGPRPRGARCGAAEQNAPSSGAELRRVGAPVELLAPSLLSGRVSRRRSTLLAAPLSSPLLCSASPSTTPSRELELCCGRWCPARARRQPAGPRGQGGLASLSCANTYDHNGHWRTIEVMAQGWRTARRCAKRRRTSRTSAWCTSS
jgi:hypothetical protein